MATNGAISVGSKKYAVGLYWQVSDSKNLTRAARTAIKQGGLKADFFSIRTGNKQGRIGQFGISEGLEGQAWNMPSAAVTLANRQPGSWAGVFAVGDGFWFVEIRDDLIAPEGDIYCPDESSAMHRLQDASGRGGLEKIFAPAAWGIPGAELSSLAALLNNKAEGRLQPTVIPKEFVRKVFIGLIILGALGAAAGIMYTRHLASLEEAALAEQARLEEERKRLEEQQKREKLQQEKQKQLEASMTTSAYQRLWEVSPAPVQWLTACEEAMRNIEANPLGWELERVDCTGAQLLVSWRRTEGPGIMPEGANVSPALTSADRAVPVRALPARGEQKIWPARAISSYILQNDWEANISYVADDPPQKAADGTDMPLPPWKKRKFTWDVDFAPWGLKGPLVDLPGLIVERLTWSPRGRWQLEGTIYEQR